ncbi:MAG TPA: hypothetical protein VGV64_02385, partial [Thermoplasmata archaeon]|nr:hypothetical protein [Thermoplasmata archaeon]
MPPLRNGLDLAYRFLPRGGGWEREFVRRFGERLAADPSGGTALLERWGSGTPFLVPASEATARAIVEAAAPLPGRLEMARPVPPDPLLSGTPRLGSVRFGVLLPVDRPEGTTELDRRRGRREDRPTPAWTDGGATPWDGGAPSPAVSVQLHAASVGDGRLAVRIRIAGLDPVGGAVEGLLEAEAGRLAAPLQSAGETVDLCPRRPGYRAVRAWRRATLSGLSEGRPFLLTPGTFAEVAVGPNGPRPLDEALLARHVVAVGSSGAGKTSFLAEAARRRISGGGATVVFDVHGDLGPSIVAGLTPLEARRVTAVDLGRPVGEVPGVPLFAGRTDEAREREVAQLVAGFRHLAADGSEVYWGARLEQLFDLFLRLVEEEGGGFRDLHELLTDRARREAVRWTTRRPVAARFLDELEPLLKRHPDYLQGAVARVQKLVLQPKLLALFEPGESPVPVDDLLERGAAVVFRIPSAEVGPAASRFATTLLASRLYLAMAARSTASEGLRVLFVVDEAQAIAPTLLAEILAEGRKFGIGLLVATQYPERLAPEARGAAAGAAATHLCFGVPRSAAATVGRWFGLERVEAERILPSLPPGVALFDPIGAPGAPRLISVPPMSPSWSRWDSVVAASRASFGPSDDRARPVPSAIEALDESILLGIVAGASEDRGNREADLVAPGTLLGKLGGDPIDRSIRLAALARRGWIVRGPNGLELTPAGSRRLGLGSPSGATRESTEHRALLVAAFGVFARLGERMEFVRQGRFDARLPDAVVRMFPRGLPRDDPRAAA